MKITLVKEHYTKNETKWQLDEAEPMREITEEHYRNMVDPKALQFFRNLGGKEIVERNYTCKGYVPVKVHSISPDRTEKYVYRFGFEM